MALSTIPFYANKHIAYIKKIANDKGSFEYYVTQQFRMSGVYWGLTALAIMGRDLSLELNVPEIVEWVLSCQHDNGGFSADVGHDPHVLYTLSAIQILVLCKSLDRIDRVKVGKFVSSLQQSDGSFFGDKWGEVDTRFIYCSASALSLLGLLNEEYINIPAAVGFISRCSNFDGGFGAVPDAESHAAQVFCCVGALSILKHLHVIDIDLLGWWLSERQCDSGGLNGRPEKQADVCYSWWILSCLRIIGRDHWINRTKLINFILECQDSGIVETPPVAGVAAGAQPPVPPTAEHEAGLADPLVGGGIAERPGNMADIFHTFFGIAGLSLMNYFSEFSSQPVELFGYEPAAYNQICPTYALPRHLLDDLCVTSQANSVGAGVRPTAGVAASAETTPLADAIKNFMDFSPSSS